MTGPVAETFATPDDFGEPRSSEVQTSLGEQLGAEAGESFMGGARMLMRGSQYLGARYGVDPLAAMGAADAGPGAMDIYQQGMRDQAAAPDVSIGDAKAQVKQEGLEGELTLPDQPTIRQPVLDLMLRDARERAQYNAAVNRGPQGFLPGALGFLTQVGVGMVDPVNAAAFSIPVMGEARMGKLLASAGDSILARAAVKTGVGAAQGAVGGAALVPADWWLHTQDGQDYTMADALKSVVLSAGMGAGFHAGGGVLGDVLARLRGRPLAGSPEDLLERGLMAGTHVPGAALADEGVPAEEVPGISVLPPRVAAAADAAAEAGARVEINGQEWRHPAEILADLPQAAQENVVQATAADLINGNAPRAGELLEEAAKGDPRVAESIEAWHGSPHDFDRFDMSKIGTGEGAQSYGHGGKEVGLDEVKARAKPKAAKAEGPQSLLEFLASRGGIRDDDPLIEDLRGSVGKNKFVPRFGNLIRKPEDLSTAAQMGGAHAPMTLDQAREAAVEAGYLSDHGDVTGGVGTSTISDLLEAVDREARGQRVYPEGQGKAAEIDADEERHHMESALDLALTEAGISPADATGKTRERTLEIMAREGMHDDPVGAFERAAMEEELNGSEAGHFQPSAEKIPGWDATEDAGAAPRESGGAAQEPVAGSTPRGEEPGNRGEADRAPRQAAGGVADWKKLAEARPEDADLSDAAREADKTEAPASAEAPARSVSAAQAAAGEADKLLADLLPKLTDDERKTFEDALTNLENDKTAREQMVRDGAACLAGAVVEEAA